MQYFERVRLEYHSENEGTQYVILLRRLVAELGYGQPWFRLQELSRLLEH